MPIGVLTDCAAVALGGIIGTLAGKRIPRETREQLTVIFGFCAMGIGINSIIKASSMTPVILAVILGSLLGSLWDLEGKIQGMTSAALKRLPLRGETDLNQLMIVIVLFCFSGFGYYGTFLSSMSGDHSVLISKAMLDAFTAMIFAISVGIPVTLVSLPMLAIMLALFLVGKLIAPLMSEGMMKDFIACGGILTLVTGVRVSRILHTRVINMIPALILVLPLSWLWSLLPF